MLRLHKYFDTTKVYIEFDVQVWRLSKQNHIGNDNKSISFVEANSINIYVKYKLRQLPS